MLTFEERLSMLAPQGGAREKDPRQYGKDYSSAIKVASAFAAPVPSWGGGGADTSWAGDANSQLSAQDNLNKTATGFAGQLQSGLSDAVAMSRANQDKSNGIISTLLQSGGETI